MFFKLAGYQCESTLKLLKAKAAKEPLDEVEKELLEQLQYFTGDTIEVEDLT